MAPSKEVLSLTSAVRQLTTTKLTSVSDYTTLKYPRIVIGKPKSRIGRTFVGQFIRPGQFAHKMDELNPQQEFTIEQYYMAWEYAVNLIWKDAMKPDDSISMEEFSKRFPGLEEGADRFRERMVVEKQAVIDLIRSKEDHLRSILYRKNKVAGRKAIKAEEDLEMGGMDNEPP
ncbi:hypothetical protein BDZ45DRAFT_727232, partial [Acephala macrosclerotiorum]